jgi:hypothetical protein
MNPPLFALAAVLGAPLLAAVRPRAGLVLVALLGLLGGWSGEGWIVTARALLLAGAACGLAASSRRALGTPSAFLGVWAGLGLAPWWLPAAAERWTGAPAALDGRLWAAWPGAPLASEAWDPLREGPLYAAWGARTEVYEPGVFLPVFVLGLTAAVLYFLRPASPLGSPETPTEQAG